MVETANFQVIHEMIEAARSNLQAGRLELPCRRRGNGDDGQAQPAALDMTAFRPRVLAGRVLDRPDVRVPWQRLRLPVLMAPVGSLEAFVEGGAGASAQGAGIFSCPLW